jgi:hypothetical protein
MHRLAEAGPRGPSDQEISEEIWTELLRAIGLTLPSASRLRHDSVREQATAACRALDQLAQSNHHLSVFLKELQEAKSDALAQKYGELNRSFDGDARRQQLLDEVAEDLETAFKALLLLPEVGIVQDLIERLEEAAQADDGQAPGEQELLVLLRAVHNEIGRIDKSRPEAWKNVADMIENRRADAPTHTIRELDPANKQPI